MQIVEIAVSAAAGLISGGVSAMWLEGVFRPNRDRRRTAGLLALEIEANGRLLYDRYERDEKRAAASHIGMSSDLVLHRIALEAVATHIRELPEKASRGVLRVYHLYSHVEEMHRRRIESFREYVATIGDAHKSEVAESNFHVVTRVWRKNVWHILETTAWLYPELRAIAKMRSDSFPELPPEPVPVPEQKGLKSEVTVPDGCR